MIQPVAQNKSIEFHFVRMTNEIVVLLNTDLTVVESSALFKENFPSHAWFAQNLNSTVALRSKILGAQHQSHSVRIEHYVGYDWQFSYVQESAIFIGVAKKKQPIDYQEELSTFLSIISHDLNDPVRTIRTFINFLKQDLADKNDTRISEDLAYLQEGAEKLNQRLNGILAFSRLGKTELQQRTLNIDTFIDHIIADDKYARIKTKTTENTEILCASTELLEIAIIELLDNALKFSKGPVELLQTDEAITIKDKGIGFDEKHIQNILNPFYTIHRRGPYSGLGIGLALVRKSCDILGFQLSIQSQKEMGSEFSISWY